MTSKILKVKALKLSIVKAINVEEEVLIENTHFNKNSKRLKRYFFRYLDNVRSRCKINLKIVWNPKTKSSKMEKEWMLTKIRRRKAN